MVKMQGGEAVVETLLSEGVEVIFELPGLQTLPIYDALYHRRRPRHIMVKHEANGAVMADVYGRLTGEPGVCLFTAGPGATNSITGVAQAYAASSPLLHITGTVPRDASLGVLHGVVDPDFLLKVFKPVTKWSATASSLEEIAPLISKGYRTAKQGRKGPVHIDIREDILHSTGEITIPPPSVEGSSRWDEDAVSTAARLLASAESPVIYAGTDASRDQAHEELLSLAELLQAPVVPWAFLPDIIPEDHRLSSGCVEERDGHPAALHALNSADILFAVGVRIGSTEGRVLKKLSGKRVIHLDLEVEPTAGYGIEVEMVGSIKGILRRLLEHLQQREVKVKDSRLIEQINSIKREVSLKRSEALRGYEEVKPIHPGVAMRELRRILERDAIIVTDQGLHVSWARDYCPSLTSNSYLYSGSYGSMGFGFPAALATKVVHPERQVVCIPGDGGFLMSYMDMPTALEYGLNIMVIITNNRRYGSIWITQKEHYGGRYISIDLHPTNYALLAESFGAKGIRVEDPRDLPSAYEEALSSKVLTVVDIVTECKYIPLRVREYFRQLKST